MVRGADVGCLEAVPVDVVAELLKVANDLIEAQGEVPADVLEHAQGGADDRNGVGDDGPQVALILRPEPLAGGRERLARVSRRDDVDLADPLRPVHDGHVADVGYVGVAVREDFARALVDVGHGYRLGAERSLEGAINAPVCSLSTGSCDEAAQT